MQRMRNIEMSSKKAQAFLDFIKTLDFIKVKEKEYTKSFSLSEEQKNILNERKAKHLKGESKSYSWNEIKEELRGSENENL